MRPCWSFRSIVYLISLAPCFSKVVEVDGIALEAVETAHSVGRVSLFHLVEVRS
jgi:hypothetical protein